jgi:tetratricopeptide (TPR) repeat protein
MATFNKRGYKAPKPKEEKTNTEFVEDDVQIDEKDSTTAGVFNSLDETASKAEDFVAKYQKVILGVVVAIAVIAIGYLAYEKYVAEPKENEAVERMATAELNFRQATDGVKSDSLYALALNGSEGKFGFARIAEEYSGTDAGNLANYYAGMSSLNLGKFDDAIKYLEKFKSDDMMLSALATGAIGDAYAEKNNMAEALNYYAKAADKNNNNFTTPVFLMKAGKAALAVNKKADALKYFNEIKDKYEMSQEAQNVDALIGLAQ